ncbi:CsbD family protein [Limosilactobacillus fermentum]|uniref:CsbD family protein n=1 Tax=Limosilactobacillus fermentum TaxID=1613 RepID=UPI003D780F7D
MSDNGTVDKIKGTVKEAAGDVTDDKKLKAGGILDKTVGKVKEAAEDVKDTAEGVAKDIKEKFDK